MSHVRRNVEDCPFRSDVGKIQDREMACCGFLREITGVKQVQLCHVARDACEACAETFLPSFDDINPVVASLLFNLTEQITSAGGTAGCDANKARRLNAVATDSIPTLLPGEDDCVAVKTRLGRSANRLPPVEQLLPKPTGGNRASIEKWSVGVTTAPRRVPTLDDCLDSLIAAGFQKPRLFMDSAVPVSAEFADLDVTLREPQIGAWPSYYLALVELIMREPDADAFMLVQDDALFFDHPDLREYLEQAMWPEDTPAIASLFCPSRYTQPVDGWQQFPSDNAWVFGAETFVFSRDAARQFIADEIVVLHRWRPGKDGLVHIDDVIGEWVRRQQVPLFYPTPSLVQHIGHVSTLWPSVRAVGRRRADRFAGDIIDQ